jgi:two-component system response regulator YesN
MYSVVLIDDDPLTVKALEQCIDWEKFSLQVSATFYNGEDAKEFIIREKPEIVLTDIRMPKMDGIQLMNEVRNNKIQSKIIILSAYDDFFYAQKAIHYGASGYLLKPLDEEQLEEMMFEIVDKINNEKKKARMLELMDDCLCNTHVEILKRILSRNICKEEIQEVLEKLGLEIAETSYILMVSQILEREQKASGSKVDDLFLLNQIKSQFKDYPGSTSMYADKNKILYIIKDAQKVPDLNNIPKLVKHIEQLLASYGYACTFTVGEPFITVDEIQRHIREIIHKSKFYFYEPKRIIYTSQIKQTMDMETQWLGFEKSENIIEKIILGQSFEQIEEITTVIDELEKNKNVDPTIIYKEILDLLNFLKRSFINRELTTIQKLENINDEDIKKYKNLEELRNYLKELFNGIAEEIKATNETKYIIEKAKKYAKQHLSEPITLEDITDEIKISKNYFCNLFKEETGETFWDYLTKVRVDKAKELLHTDMKNYEVALQVGYENPSYLSKVFKKYVGITPSEYRKKII